MLEALKEAEQAFGINEVPVGAVIVKDGEIISRGHNTREKDKNPLGHAEINAIDEAASKCYNSDSKRHGGTLWYR